MNRPTERSLVFNVVWTGRVFGYLAPFVTSLMARSEARFRFVANGCPPDQVEAMEGYRSRHADRVVEVLDVSPHEMVAHGVALDRVRHQRDDGEHFCLVDPDIKATGPWLAPFTELLAHHQVVTSGQEVWSTDNLVPPGHVGVAGEHFVDQDGFVFGSPHLALYHRATLDATSSRWGVGLGSAGPDLSDEATAAMASMGHRYLVYDTTKIVNALIQHDGGSLVHRDLPELVHIGGLAHFLAPPGYRTDEQGDLVPDWTKYDSMQVRHEVTRYTAATLRALADGDDPPAVPTGLAPDVAERLLQVRSEVTDLMARFGSEARP